MRVYLLIAVPAVAALLYAVPPLQSPDEAMHLIRAEQVSRGGILPVRDARGRVGQLVDRVVPAFQLPFLEVFGRAKKKLNPVRYANAQRMRWSGRATFAEVPGMTYGPVTYLPQAAGLGLGRSLGLGVLHSYGLARAFNATAAVGIGALALRLATHGQLAFFVVLFLPMTLFQIASTSQDALQITGGLLAAALATRIEAGAASTRAALGIGLLAGALAIGRPPAAAVALLAAVPGPRGRWWSRGLLAGLVTAAVVAVWLGLVLADYREPRRNPGMYDPWQQIAVIAAAPGALWQTFAKTFEVAGWVWLRQGIGILGWLDTTLPAWAYSAATAALLLASAVDPFAEHRPRAGARLVYAAALAAGILAILLAAYLAWTPVGAGRIRGIQGRYFLSWVPLLGLAAAAVVPAARLRRVLQVAAVVFAATSAAVTIRAVWLRYY